MGTPDFAVPPLKALAKYDCNIKLVITQPDRPKGRGKKIMAPPVKTTAMELGLDIMQVESMHGKAIKKKLAQIKPDIFVVVAFGYKLSREILSIPSIFPINIHASLLPKYRGSSPIQAAILNMDSKTGVTTMVMDENLDTGDILLKAETPINCDTTASDLHDLLAQTGADLIIKTIDAIYDNRITPVPQNHEIATFAPILKKEDGKIDWNNKPEKIHALVRAMTPWPGAFTFLKGKRIKIFKIFCTDKNFDTGKDYPEINTTSLENIAPGTIFHCDSKGIYVAAGNTGYLIILELQKASGKRLHACEFLRGRKLETGIRFDN